MNVRKPKLVPLDLRKGEGHEHPDIKTDGTQYLCEIGKGWYAGGFNRQWYGLNFDGWAWNSLQYDKPGTNASNWKQVFEMVFREKK